MDDLLITIRDKLVLQGRTVATAESFTGGRVASCLTSLSGSSKVYVGGVVAYTLDLKVKMLGVDATEARRCDCVSVDVVRQMATGVVKLTGADIGVATTGFAEQPDGFFDYFVCAWSAPTGHLLVHCIGTGKDRNTVQIEGTRQALELLLVVVNAGG